MTITKIKLPIKVWVEDQRPNRSLTHKNNKQQTTNNKQQTTNKQQTNKQQTNNKQTKKQHKGELKNDKRKIARIWQTNCSVT